MTTYNTGNPVPSADARDRFDNSQTLDELINGLLDRYTNRVGTGITSMTGMERLFNQAQSYRAEHFSELMLKSGYETPVPYSTGLLFERYTQLIERDGEFYRAKPGVIPFTTIGDWATDSANLVAVGDASIRSELGSEYGAELVKLDGRSVADTTRDTVNVKDGRFGAIGDGTYHPLSERYANLGLAQAKYPFATSLAQSIDWAACQKAVNTNKLVRAPSGIYVLTDKIRMTGAQWIDGDGVDAWEHLNPAEPKKNLCGTHFVMYGTIAKDLTFYGVTDMRTAGGVVANPDSVNALDTQYALTSFHNNDASDGVASTLRQVSAGFYVAPNSQRGGITNLRVHPNFNGINGYNDLLTTGLGDECDIGIFLDNCPHFTVDNVQCVGYWRIRGIFVGCVSRDSVQGANFFTNINKCLIQQGLEIRGGDQVKSLATTSNTIDVPWADNHPFKVAGVVSTPRGNFTYTSTSKVSGTPNGTVLRFNGVTPNPSAASLGSGPVRISSGSGIGGMSITGGTIITGLDHSSMCLSSNPLIGLGVSTALMISGTLRQPWFSQTYVQTREDVIAHFHACEDMRFSQIQFEANDFRLVPGGSFSPTHGGRILASPQDIANPLATASGDTSLSLYQGHCAPYVDMFPKVARASGSKFSSPIGLFNPRKLQYLDLQMPDSDHLDISPLLTQNLRLNLAPGMQFLVRDSATQNLITVSESSGSLSLSKGQFSLPSTAAGFINAGSGQVLNFRQGTTLAWQIAAAASLLPGTDATQNLASAAARINNSFFAVAPTVTSDAELKVIRGELSATELAVWGSVRAKVFQMKDMVAQKGVDNARLHAGYVAQEVQQAFLDQGLDASRYGLLCEDSVTKTVSVLRDVVKQKTKTVTDMKEVIEVRDGVPVRLWVPEVTELVVTEQVALVDEEGSPVLGEDGEPRYVNLPVTEAMDEWVDEQVPDGTRLGLRYEQCLVFETAYLRSLVADLTDRVAALEA